MAEKKKPGFKMRVVQEPKKRPKLTKEQMERDVERIGNTSSLSYQQKRRLLDQERKDRKEYEDYRKSSGLDEYEKKVKAGTVTLEDIDEFGDYDHPLYQKFLRDNPNTMSKAQIRERYERIEKAENKHRKALRKAAEAKVKK